MWKTLWITCGKLVENSPRLGGAWVGSEGEMSKELSKTWPALSKKIFSLSKVGLSLSEVAGQNE